jgi:hypothetical protein
MRKRMLRWSIIWASAFAILALVPVVPLYKGGTDIGPMPLLLCYMHPRSLLPLWPYVLGHLAVTTLVAAQIAARPPKAPERDPRGNGAGP